MNLMMKMKMNKKRIAYEIKMMKLKEQLAESQIKFIEHQKKLEEILNGTSKT